VAAAHRVLAKRSRGNRSEQDHRRLGRRLRLGVIGGPEIVHRRGAPQAPSTIMSRSWLGAVVEPGAFAPSGKDVGIVPERAFGSAKEMLAIETSRPDGMEVVAIMTPQGHGADLTPAERGGPSEARETIPSTSRY
jgi:hypothetical protein